MSDQAIAAVRTSVPLIVGWVIGWLATHGVTVDTDGRALLAALVTAAAAVADWAGVTLLSRVWPRSQVMLGIPKTPTYSSDAAGSTEDELQ